MLTLIHVKSHRDYEMKKGLCESYASESDNLLLENFVKNIFT